MASAKPLTRRQIDAIHDDQWEIVKVQLSTRGKPGVLIYNEDRSLFYIERDPETIEAVKHHLDGACLRAFCRAVVVDTKIQLFEKVEEQGW